MSARMYKGQATEQVLAIVRNPSDEPIPMIAGLEIPAHDYISLSYTGADLTGVVYKDGGSSGTTVATLTLTYDASGYLSSVAKS